MFAVEARGAPCHHAMSTLTRLQHFHCDVAERWTALGSLSAVGGAGSCCWRELDGGDGEVQRTVLEFHRRRPFLFLFLFFKYKSPREACGGRRRREERSCWFEVQLASRVMLEQQEQGEVLCSAAVVLCWLSLKKAIS